MANPTDNTTIAMASQTANSLKWFQRFVEDRPTGSADEGQIPN
ncbi:MAG: hypothetical protein ABJN98_17615 [Roseibium sp.]